MYNSHHLKLQHSLLHALNVKDQANQFLNRFRQRRPRTGTCVQLQFCIIFGPVVDIQWIEFIRHFNEVCTILPLISSLLGIKIKERLNCSRLWCERFQFIAADCCADPTPCTKQPVSWQTVTETRALLYISSNKNCNSISRACGRRLNWLNWFA